MRRVLVDHAKSRSRLKRNSGVRISSRKIPAKCCRRWISTSSRSMTLSRAAAIGAALGPGHRAALFRRSDVRPDRRRRSHIGRDRASRHSSRAGVAAQRNQRLAACMIPRARWQQIHSLFEQLIDAAATSAMHGWRAPAATIWNCVPRRIPARLGCRREDVLLQAIGEAAESLLQEHQDRLIGTRIGPYRVASILATAA